MANGSFISAPQTQLRVASVDQMLSRAPADAQSWLAPSEWQRCQRLMAPQRRSHYLAGHWLLRELLAPYRRNPTEPWQIIDRPSLPPTIADRPELFLSLSHSGPWIACAVSTAPIGIDLEQRRPRPALAGFDQLLRNPDEPADSLDLDALLQRWVVKEAFIKRDCGSALPERLAELHLHASGEPGCVCLWEHSQFLLGSTDHQVRPLVASAVPGDQPRVLQHWRVVDRGMR
ncbi:MAG: hypothetical protein KDI71_01855 [Xanthomonadales bacterium]|nr:hypothetical protein [Xanthomonadales bacterium]